MRFTGSLKLYGKLRYHQLYNLVILILSTELFIILHGHFLFACVCQSVYVCVYVSPSPPFPIPHNPPPLDSPFISFYSYTPSHHYLILLSSVLYYSFLFHSFLISPILFCSILFCSTAFSPIHLIFFLSNLLNSDNEGLPQVGCEDRVCQNIILNLPGGAIK
jgi:hypothetical protein